MTLLGPFFVIPIRFSLGSIECVAYHFGLVAGQYADVPEFCLARVRQACGKLVEADEYLLARVHPCLAVAVMLPSPCQDKVGTREL